MMKQLLLLCALVSMHCLWSMEHMPKKDERSSSIQNLLAFKEQLNEHSGKEASVFHYVVGTQKIDKIMGTLLLDALQHAGTRDIECNNLLFSSLVNGIDADGQTPLHWAAQLGNLESWQHLVKYGANLMIQDNEGCTPLHVLDSCMLKDWEFDKEKSERFMAFVSAPIGGLLTLGHDVSLYKDCLYTTHHVLMRNIPPLNEDALGHIIERVFLNLMNQETSNLYPSGKLHKNTSISTLIKTVPYAVLKNFVSPELLVKALVDSHLSLLASVKEKEREAGNAIFAHKLEQISHKRLVSLCTQNYTKLLLESIKTVQKCGILAVSIDKILC